MQEQTNSTVKLINWLSLIKRFSSWIALIAFISLLIPHILIEQFEPNAWKWASGAPRPPEWQFQWRNISLMIMLIAAVVSFPRWQSLVVLGITLFLMCYAACGI